MISILRRWGRRYFGDEQAVWFILASITFFLSIIYLGHVLVPLLTAVILAYLLKPLMDSLVRMSLPSWLSALLVSGGLVMLLALTFFGLLPLLWIQGSTLLVQIPNMLRDFHEATEKLLSMTIEEDLARTWLDGLSNQINLAGQWIISESLATLVGLVQVLIYTILVPLLVFFLLRDSNLFFAFIARLLPRSSAQGFLRTIWEDMDRQLANYVRGKVLEIVIMTIASLFVYALFSLNYALLLALLTGVSVIIPYVGAAVVTVPIVLVAFLQWGLTEIFLWFSLVYVLLQVLDGNVLVPLLFSEAVSLHPVVIVISILLFGGIWGLWGVFFAIPLATFIKAIFDAWPSTD